MKKNTVFYVFLAHIISVYLIYYLGAFLSMTAFTTSSYSVIYNGIFLLVAIINLPVVLIDNYDEILSVFFENRELSLVHLSRPDNIVIQVAWSLFVGFIAGLVLKKHRFGAV